MLLLGGDTAEPPDNDKGLVSHCPQFEVTPRGGNQGAEPPDSGLYVFSVGLLQASRANQEVQKAPRCGFPLLLSCVVFFLSALSCQFLCSRQELGNRHRLRLALENCEQRLNEVPPRRNQQSDPVISQMLFHSSGFCVAIVG